MEYDSYTVAGLTFQITDRALASALGKSGGFGKFADRTAGHRIPDFYFGMRDKSEDISTLELLYGDEKDGIRYGFYSMTRDGHMLIQKDSDGHTLKLWSIPSEDTVWLSGILTARMLRFALWTGYGLRSADRMRIAVHGSCTVQDSRAWLFLGESGTGKSTHTRLWEEYIPGAYLLNDDSPVISVEDDMIWIYGSPWSGKTPCYRQERYPLCGCVRLSQAPYNRMVRLSGLNAYAALHPSCPPGFAYDTRLYDGISRTLGIVLSRVPVYHLECLPDKTAALLSYNTLTGHDK